MNRLLLYALLALCLTDCVGCWVVLPFRTNSVTWTTITVKYVDYQLTDVKRLVS